MPELHISSLLLHLVPASVEATRAAVLDLGGEVHAVDERGKMVVTLETDSEHDISERLTRLQLLPGVMAATLVFHHVETLEDEDDEAAAAAGGHACA
ncbi:MAG: chaperone NapD [Planctomycetes bacterium]|nr:chaperone NapD [Planctomycetota bacterium]